MTRPRNTLRRGSHEPRERSHMVAETSWAAGGDMDEPLVRRLGAEFLGTFVLVFAGCGTAILDAGNHGVDLLGVAFAFGLAVLVMVYAVGAISGGHFNPAVTLGLAVARRFPWADVLAYVVTQVVAALAASLLL